MSRDILQAGLDAIEESVVYPFFAVELLFDNEETLRMWNGVGELVYEGNSYFGVGNLIDISEVEESSELSVKGARINLSGVPQDVLSLALNEPYQGREANIFFGTFAKGLLQEQPSESYILLQDGGRIELQEQLTSLTKVFSGFMDQMIIDEGPNSSTIELTIENRLIDLERPRVLRYTDPYQKSIYPDDRGLEYVDAIQDQTITWGSA